MPAPNRRLPWRSLCWTAAAALLGVPLIAGAPWTPSDYVFAAVMIGIAGGAIELGVRASPNLAWRAGSVVAVLTAFLLLWTDAAVGILGDGDNPAILLFLGVVAVALGGILRAGRRGDRAARAMLATATAQVAASVIGWSAGWAVPGQRGVYEAVVSAALFGTLWLIAAALFAQSVAHSRTASPSI